MYVNQPVLEQQFHYTLALDGHLDENRLRQAIRLAMDAEPVFGCRYVSGRRPHWERRDDLDRLPLCEVVESHAPLADLSEFMARPCSATTDPLVQACIARGAGDTLCLKISHVACDGAGGKEFMEQLASLYRKLGDDPSYSVTPNLGSRSRLQLFREYGWRRTLRALLTRAGRPRESQWRFPTTNPEDRGAPKLAMRQLDREQSRAVRAYAKQAGAAPTEVFLTAYFRALWHFLNAPTGTPQTIAIPLNAREYLASGRTEAICNFIAPLFLSLERIPGEAFAATLERVRERTQNRELWRQRARAGAFWISLATRLALPRMQGAIEASNRKNVASGLTMAFLTVNGTFEPSLLDFGFPVIDVFQSPPMAFAPGVLLAISSFRNVLSFTVRYPSRAMKGEDVERFLDAFVAELPALPNANQ